MEFEGDINNKFSYGALYNGYAVWPGKLCPTGWSVPASSEWVTILVFLGANPGYQMKATGSLSWGVELCRTTYASTTNSSSITNVPAGGQGDKFCFYKYWNQ